MRIPDCHPDRKHAAKGKCAQCYYAKYNSNKLTATREKKAKLYTTKLTCEKCNKEKNIKDFCLNKKTCLNCYHERKVKQIQLASNHKGRNDCKHIEFEDNCRFCIAKKFRQKEEKEDLEIEVLHPFLFTIQQKTERKLQIINKEINALQDVTINLLMQEIKKLRKRLEKNENHENELLILNEKLQENNKELKETNQQLRKELEEIHNKLQVLIDSQNAFAGDSRP